MDAMQIVYGIVFAAAGVGIRQLMRAKAVSVEAEAAAAANWPTAAGRIEHSRVRQSRNAGVVYPDLRVAYDVGGRTYLTKDVTFGGFAGSAADARALTARFPEGSVTDVRYNPDRPARAVLIAAANPAAWRNNANWLCGAFVLGGVIVAAAGIMG